jgi:predicted Na+-dependent transporter
LTAQHLFTVLFNAGIAISIGATVASLGMSFTVHHLIAPLRRVALVLATVVLNALVIPAAAWGIAKATPMANQYVAGLVLATIGAGSAGALKGAQLAKRTDLPLAVSLVVVLQIVDIGTQLNGAANYIGPAITFALVSLILPMVLAVEIGRKATIDPDVERSEAP